MLNIRHLACALEIRRFSNLSEAARQVHLSQSALTQGIKKLEDKLGFLLFLRGTSGMYVTERGELFLHRFERAYEFLESYAASHFATDKGARIALLRGITARQLVAIINMIEFQNYSRASEAMGIAQPTLHRTVKDLEILCEVSLFNRSPSGTEPTWRARKLARVGGLYFAELQQGFDDVATFDGKYFGSLRIGSLPLSLTDIVPTTVLKTMERIPKANIRISDGPYNEQVHALLHGDIDILIGALRPNTLHEHLEQYPLFNDKLSVVTRARHPTSQSGELDWDTAEWILPLPNTPARQVFNNLIRQNNLSLPENVIECGSLTAIRALLMKSDRMVMLPARQVAVDVNAGLLAIVDVPLEDPARIIGYTIRKNWIPTKLQSTFISVLSSVCHSNEHSA